MGFNDLLQTVGGWGRFQVLNTAMLLFPMILMASHNFLQNFTAAVPPHRCRIPKLDNDSVSFNLSNIATFIPVDDNLKSKSCIRFRNAELGLWNNVTSTNNTESCKDGWVYDRSIFISTIVTEWDLVCDLRKMRQVAQSIYMAGVLVGAFVLGNLSDRFGRKAILTGSYFVMAMSGTCVAFLPNFVAYCIFRCLCGMAFSGIVLNTISLCLEWTPSKGRTVIGTLFAYSFTCGQLLLAGLAYEIREWRWLQFTISAPYYVFFLTSWFVPESARWLIVKGHPSHALRNLQKVAWINGKKEEGEKLTEKALIAHMQSELSSIKQSHSLLDLFRTPGMRQITIFLMLVWFSTSFAFYGLGMDLQNFGISIFLLQLVFGSIDLPAKLGGAILMSCIGRRVTQSGSLILAGVALLCNAFLPQDLRIVRVVLAVFGKGFLASSFCCAYLYSSELFPTVIRQSGMGVVAMTARMGSMVAPLVLMLSEISPIFPPATYGVAAIISGIVAVFLSETCNLQLPDTIEEVEARSKGKAIHRIVPKEEVPLTQSQPQAQPSKRLLVETV
ncbi:solute carrier family 22 member 20-like isoform X1 [Rana temporaria]|uniref:solute carrier family 22 member 20-like isoform X1 n=1 Tax=Rana temporaria TaxID=8407 RepID=UPI001AADAE69|nr:solute carrier family 22 member 20-like isoform X1 [Rana temporaria]